MNAPPHLDGMPSMTGPAPRCAAEAELLDRWRRLQMIVRCGLTLRPDDHVRLYLQVGGRVARRGLCRPGAAQRLMLRTLLRSAADAALPGPLRRACATQAVPLLAQVRALFGRHERQLVQGLEAEWRQAAEAVR